MVTPPPPPLIPPGAYINQGWLAGQRGGLLGAWGDYLTLLLCTRDRAKNFVPGVP